MKVFNYLRALWGYWIKFRFRKKLAKMPIQLGERVLFKKEPIIQLHPKAKLIIGDNTTINSDNYGYHVNMFSQCKLMADREDAIITIGSNTRIHGSAIHAYKSISIGDNCLIAANCQIIDCNGHDLSFDNVDNRINTHGHAKAVVIENSVWLGTGVVVLPGVTIGRGSVISANSVVNCDVPPMCVAGGNPLQIIKQIKP
ncbi:MAG TPA: acyltransferase [Flavobacterium sp.]|uniref:acyltransferase n=2 Tax=Flavobacterium TaxID=237 RepID=UPI0025B9258D|nr:MULTISPECIES: acyltransferase [unclassified Flavobacterium]HRE77341.1 acyltransferase [Flavobacterium sp.]